MAIQKGNLDLVYGARLDSSIYSSLIHHVRHKHLRMPVIVGMSFIRLFGGIRGRDGFLRLPGHAKGSGSRIGISCKSLFLPLRYIDIFNVIRGSYLGSAGVVTVFAVFMRMAMVMTVKKQASINSEYEIQNQSITIKHAFSDRFSSVQLRTRNTYKLLIEYGRVLILIW